MSIEKLKRKQIKMKEELSQTEKLISHYNFVKMAIDDIKYLQKNAGSMSFVGKSGKINEEEILREIYINGIAGCVEVPQLILKLAEEKLCQIELEIKNYI